ncbi:MAG: hypothetical protein AAGG81_08990 [Chlamydiota bacterium]
MLFSISLPRSREITKLVNWELEFPLVIGNEATQDRPWNGHINKLVIWDKALEELDALMLLKNSNNTFPYPQSLLLSYLFDAKQLSQEESPEDFLTFIRLPKLLKSKILESTLVNEKTSYITDSSVAMLNEKIRISSEFTLYTSIQALAKNQTGPARIISISKDAYNRNLTIAQSMEDLIIRLRTPLTGNNGMKPEFVVRDVFATLNTQPIILIYDGATLKVYTKNLENFASFNLFPSISFFKFALPNQIDNFGSENAVLFYYLMLAASIFLIVYLAIQI